MNVFTFTGNLGKDAERRSVGASTVANFSVPVKAGFGDKQTTTWINCALWGKRAEGGLIDLLTKGTPVCVSGELSQREWTNQSGEIKTSLECKVNEVTLMGKGQAKKSVEPDASLDDHIPF
jgi:single-strand DNA-binding protein